MSMSQNIMASTQEPVEREEVSKLEVDEEQLPPLQYINETDETPLKTLVMKKKPLSRCLPGNNEFTMR